MAKIKGMGIDVIGTPDSTREAYDRAPEYARQMHSDPCGAFQGTAPEDVPGIRKTNAIELRSDIDTEIGQQRPILDDKHPSEFMTTSGTKGGSDPTRR